MMVKICGITNCEDAMAAVRGGASALGFNFYPGSPRYITPDAAAGIIGILPAPVLKVGVFVNETAAAVGATAARAGLDVAQLHGEESSSGWPHGLRIWRALRAHESFRPENLSSVEAEAVLLDAPAENTFGGTGRSWDWSRVAVRPPESPKLILAGGLDAGNVREAIRAARPWGVDACSRLEARPGVKDHARLAAFLKAALSVDL